jgi:hypothetical protein
VSSRRLGLGSIGVGHVLIISGRLSVAAGLLSLRQSNSFAQYIFVRNQAEQMRDAVQPRAALVVCLHHVPWRDSAVRRGHHLVARTRVIVPASIGFEIHWTEFPDFADIMDPRQEPPGLLLLN